MLRPLTTRSWRDSCVLLAVLTGLAQAAAAGEMRLGEQDYFTTPGADVLVFSNWYNGLFSDSKISGVELIHHGVRTATNGDVRLQATPEQWDPIPEFVERKVDRDASAITAHLRYPKFDFDYSIRVAAEGDGLKLSVILPSPLPKRLEGRAGLNLEFLPSAYFERSFASDDRTGLFPLHPVGPKERVVEGRQLEPPPLARGHRFVLAPGDPERTVAIESAGAELTLYDGRAKAQNGWFVVRSLIPPNRQGTVLQWTIRPHTVDGWVRPPVIGHSQVGYHPAQQKVAVIEMDPAMDSESGSSLEATLYRITPEGPVVVRTSVPKAWGPYKRYRYRRFDFSEVTDPGLYAIEFDGVRTATFRIAEDVYTNAWQPTLDVYLPVQMDHVQVDEAYRVWHGASHLDDARQAPPDHQHFDLYAQGPTTDTPYAPGEHIPGLNIGGWYDAGDYDIRTQTQYAVVSSLVAGWEQFRIGRDATRVDYDRKQVELHVPDGRPDLLQQIVHGTLGLVSQFRAVGHAIPGIIVPDLSQYTHLGDGMTMTDNQVYNPALGPLESNGAESGRADDRWAFTSRSSALNYGSIAALAAASRALRGYDDPLAEECLETARKTWEQERSGEPHRFRHGNTTGGPLPAEELKAALELLVATGEERYRRRFLELMPEVEEHFGFHAPLAVRALPYFGDDYRQRIRNLAIAHRAQVDALGQQNPYGVPITEGGWAGNGAVIGLAITNWYLAQAFPDLFNREDVLRSLDYLYGTHPYSDLSFVSSVGARSKRVAYGMNRADFSFIAGGIVPGVLMLKPDFPENKEDWPFLWGENEYVVSLGASYLFLVHAAMQMLPADPAATEQGQASPDR